MKAAIIGCGLIGEKRARSLRGKMELTVCCDTNEGRASSLAAKYPGSVASADWRETAMRQDVDVVMIATVHSALAEIATLAAQAGKHVLIEKPGARRAAELDPVAAAAATTGAKVRIGFNHRYHRALQKAREIADSGVLGPMMFLRGRYGHGGRPGYDKEWRSVPELSGGGESIDQGLHLIDLARWFLGEFPSVKGEVATYFWNMPVEDNAFFLLRTGAGQIASLHATWTEWKNTFSLEIYGRDGKLEVTGLGGSYGTERLAWYKMLPEMGPPETTIWEFPMADDSWDAELNAFLDDIRLNRQPKPGVPDAQAALRIVETLYKDANLDYHS
jgi:predicted dehydrogenase